MVNEKNSAGQINKKAIELGMQSLKQDGFSKIKKGLTTPDEVLRVIQTEQ